MIFQTFQQNNILTIRDFAFLFFFYVYLFKQFS